MADPYISDPKDVELEESISREIRRMGAHIHVSVRGGTISISGTADDFGDKRNIYSVVKGLSGTHKVVNNIRVAHFED